MVVKNTNIAQYVAANNGISKASAERLVADVFGFIRDSVSSNDEVVVSGFGKFTLATRAARTGRNPRTGKPIDIAESRSVKFKPTSSFKTEVK
jgi:DNA-binding protein HU-beta